MSFNRLLKALDRYIESGEIDRPVRAQIGYSEYSPRHYSGHSFFPPDEFKQLFQNAEVVVTHAGGGIISSCLQEGKKLVVVPRLKKFHEHTNDHQMELAREIKERRLARVVYDTVNLPAAIQGALREEAPAKRKKQHYRMRRLVERYLNNLEKDR